MIPLFFEIHYEVLPVDGIQGGRRRRWGRRELRVVCVCVYIYMCVCVKEREREREREKEREKEKESQFVICFIHNPYYFSFVVFT